MAAPPTNMTFGLNASSAVAGCSAWCMLPVGTAKQQRWAMPNVALCMLCANSSRARRMKCGLLTSMLQALGQLHRLTLRCCDVHADVHVGRLAGLIYVVQSHDVGKAFDCLDTPVPRPSLWPSCQILVTTPPAPVFYASCPPDSGTCLSSRRGRGAACKLYKSPQKVGCPAANGEMRIAGCGTPFTMHACYHSGSDINGRHHRSSPISPD